VVTACGGDSGGGDTVEPKLSAIETKVFHVSCGLSDSCHKSSGPPEPRMVGDKPSMGGLALDGSTRELLVNKPAEEVPGKMLVVPGDPDASYLLEKISSATPTSGKRMPDMSPPLDPG